MGIVKLPGKLAVVAISLAAMLQPTGTTPAMAHEIKMGQDHSGHMTMLAKPAEYSRSQAQYKAPVVTLTDMDGVEIALPDVLAAETPILLDFIFTSCTTICPVLSATHAEVQEMLADAGMQSDLISISIDPEQDSPAHLRSYAERFGARRNWRLFTGELADSIAVQKAFDAYRGDKANHIPLLVMRSGQGAPWVRIEGFAGATAIVDEFHRMLAGDGAKAQ